MISDVQWNAIEKVMFVKKQHKGRPEFDNRKTMEGILFIARNGSRWSDLPSEYGKKSTVHGKFMRWQRSGLLQKLHDATAAHYLATKNAASSWFAFDTAFSKAPLARDAGKNPTDRGKKGVKKSIMADFYGAPIVVGIGPANRHDTKFFLPALKKLQEFKPAPFAVIAADSAFDAKELREEAGKMAIQLSASINRRRGSSQVEFKPPRRWVIERTISWFHQYRGIKTCWAKTQEPYLGFLLIAASFQLFRML